MKQIYKSKLSRIAASKQSDIPEELANMVDEVDEDFKYVLSGVEKLCRIGKNSEASQMLTELSNQLQSAISTIADGLIR